MASRLSSFTQCKTEVSDETTSNSWISSVPMIKNWLEQLVDWLLDEPGVLLGEVIVALTRGMIFLSLCPFLKSITLADCFLPSIIQPQVTETLRFFQPLDPFLRCCKNP